METPSFNVTVIFYGGGGGFMTGWGSSCLNVACWLVIKEVFDMDATLVQLIFSANVS